MVGDRRCLGVLLDDDLALAQTHGDAADDGERVALGMEAGLEQVGAVGIADQGELTGGHEREVGAVDREEAWVAVDPAGAAWVADTRRWLALPLPAPAGD